MNLCICLMKKIILTLAFALYAMTLQAHPIFPKAGEDWKQAKPLIPKRVSPGVFPLKIYEKAIRLIKASI